MSHKSTRNLESPKKKKSTWRKILPYVALGAGALMGVGAYGSGQPGGGKNLWGNIWSGFRGLGSSIFGGTSSVELGKDTAGKDTLDAIAKTRRSKKESEGIGGFFSNLIKGSDLGDWSDIVGTVGAFIGGLDDSEFELSERALDIKEHFLEEDVRLNEESLAINRMKAEAAISAEKRQTAIGSTFIGHTNPIAMVEGVKDPGPGLIVGSAPKELASGTTGILGSSSLGTISQGTQRRLA
jgi:hypothetical protein|tara:strand:+ start:130 stop:846 length:717 start_codon:yes stop_codon:yes gene_type:complete